MGPEMLRRLGKTGVLMLAGLMLAAPLSAGRAAVPPQILGQATIAPMLEQVTPAVVNIAVRTRAQVQNPLLRDPFFRHFFNVPDEPQEQVRMSAGSGVIVDAAKGLVVTNHHVIANADEMMVTLKDRRRVRAQLVGSDPATDIAVLRIEAERLTALPVGDSDQLRVGDFVVAIGNPFGLGQTVTSGIVSALGRSGLKIEGYEDFIQTDASINPGNSGGALVDFQGRLVGINTAIIGPAGGNVGIGFAVPTSMMKAVVAQLVEYREVRRGRLGVVIQDLTPDIAETMAMAAGDGTSNGGAVVVKVEQGSPADKAGLRVGDIITAMDGRPVHSSADLRNRVGLRRIGSDVQLALLRKGVPQTITARIAQ